MERNNIPQMLLYNVHFNMCIHVKYMYFHVFSNTYSGRDRSSHYAVNTCPFSPFQFKWFGKSSHAHQNWVVIGFHFS